VIFHGVCVLGIRRFINGTCGVPNRICCCVSIFAHIIRHRRSEGKEEPQR